MVFFKEREKGQSLVEFALVAPILFFTLFVIMQLGLIFGSQIILNTAAKEAARQAAIGALDSVERDALVRNRIIDFTSYLPFIKIDDPVKDIKITPDYATRNTRQFVGDLNVVIENAYVKLIAPIPWVAKDSTYFFSHINATVRYEKGTFTLVEIEEGEIGLLYFELEPVPRASNPNQTDLAVILGIYDFEGQPIAGARVEVTLKVKHNQNESVMANIDRLTGEDGFIQQYEFSPQQNRTYTATIVKISKIEYDDFLRPESRSYTWTNQD